MSFLGCRFDYDLRIRSGRFRNVSGTINHILCNLVGETVAESMVPTKTLLRNLQERVVREIRMSRALRRELDTESRCFLTGHEGETPDTVKCGTYLLSTTSPLKTSMIQG